MNNRQDAEECVNDAYLGAWNAIPPEKPDPLLTYLCKIVRNISLKMYYRKEAAKRSSTYTIAMEEIEACISAPNTVETEFEARELARVIESFLDTLTVENRVIFMRRYWFSDSCKDIADLVGLDEKTEELKALSNEAPTLKSEIAQIRFYFENVQNRRRLDSMGQVRLAAAKEVVDKHGIRSESEIAEMEERLKLLPTYVRTVQNKLTEEQARLKRINRLADVYESVIEGNYIDNLVKEQSEKKANLLH